jgi:hypothetical protein
MPNQGNETSKISARVNNAEKAALEDIAWVNSEKNDQTTISDLVRESISLYLAIEKAHGDVPEDAKDDVEHIDVDQVLTEHGVAVAVEGRSARGVEI